MTCPHCRRKISLEDLIARLTEEEFKALRGHFHGRKQTPHAGPGRPRTAKRCPCGAMTAARAKARGHRCEEE